MTRSEAIRLGAAVGLVGLALAPLWFGFEPVGGDPDRLYRPIKAELARALSEGRLPWWSDRFGLGVPLVAESHAAAFYPPNLVLFGLLPVGVAYRASMWLHLVAASGTTWLYARKLGASEAGATVAGIAFALGGFQAIHASHEVFYVALPMLPLALWLAEGYLETGRRRWPAGLAMVLGAQWTVGHFQIQTWTNALLILIGLWRVLFDRRPLARLGGLVLAVLWGLSIAAVQLGPSWELAEVVGQAERSVASRAFYSYPPEHWAELALPRLFRDVEGGPMAPYWFGLQTSGYEAAFYVGSAPLVLACVGLFRPGRGVRPWLVLTALSLALATMPRWWPEGYAAVLRLPGLGFFRAPARYTAIATLGLSLLAGRGFDRAAGRWSWRLGLGLAGGFALAAFLWALVWTTRPAVAGVFPSPLDNPGRFGLPLLAWLLALNALIVWRWRVVPSGAKRLVGEPWAPASGKRDPSHWRPRRFGFPRATEPLIIGIILIELTFLYYDSSIQWDRHVPMSESSPVLERLAEEPSGGLVGGALENLPTYAGRRTATPYLGFETPEPGPILDALGRAEAMADPAAVRWLRRFGVSELVWDREVEVAGGTEMDRLNDRALDRLTNRPAGTPERRTWRIVRLADVFPSVRLAHRSQVLPNRTALLERLSRRDEPDVAHFVAGEAPPGSQTPRARSSRVVRWDGDRGRIEHGGACDLILNRAFYPGWTATVNGRPAPIFPADGGLIALRLDGRGPSDVALSYRPTRIRLWAGISGLALGLAVVLVAWPSQRRSV